MTAVVRRTRLPLALAKSFITDQKGKIAPLPVSEEELNPAPQYDQRATAHALEDVDRVYQVPFDDRDDSLCSEFRYFEDGRQRTIQIGHIPTSYGSNLVMIPVHYFVVAAVIVRRTERRLDVWRQPEIRQGIMVPRSLVPDQALLALAEERGLEIVDTESSLGDAPKNDYYDLRRRALRLSKKLRLEVEQKLIKAWREADDNGGHFLVVDGTLMNMRDEKNVARCVGVSKSFGSRYASASDHNRIMSMPAQYRSWAFQFHNADDEEDKIKTGVRERISWYLRLREGEAKDPEFGLVRVEISRTYAARVAEYAERFSRSLLSDRLPTSYPNARWDKHLYPIRACESYLTSVMPSISTITSSMSASAQTRELPEYED